MHRLIYSINDDDDSNNNDSNNDKNNDDLHFNLQVPLEDRAHAPWCSKFGKTGHGTIFLTIFSSTFFLVLPYIV